MKRIIAILFLLVFLFANTELHQFLKFPVLIHHYLAHHQDEKDKSFVHFLNDHYGTNPQHSDNEHNEHDNLPFKTADCATAHVSLVCVSHIQLSIPRPITFYNKISPLYNGPFYSSAFQRSIWQPPKIS